MLLNDSSFCLWIFELLSLVFEMVGNLQDSKYCSSMIFFSHLFAACQHCHDDDASLKVVLKHLKSFESRNTNLQVFCEVPINNDHLCSRIQPIQFHLDN